MSHYKGGSLQSQWLRVCSQVTYTKNRFSSLSLTLAETGSMEITVAFIKTSRHFIRRCWNHDGALSLCQWVDWKKKGTVVFSDVFIAFHATCLLCWEKNFLLLAFFWRVVADETGFWLVKHVGERFFAFYFGAVNISTECNPVVCCSL